MEDSVSMAVIRFFRKTEFDQAFDQQKRDALERLKKRFEGVKGIGFFFSGKRSVASYLVITFVGELAKEAFVEAFSSEKSRIPFRSHMRDAQLYSYLPQKAFSMDFSGIGIGTEIYPK